MAFRSSADADGRLMHSYHNVAELRLFRGVNRDQDGHYTQISAVMTNDQLALIAIPQPPLR
jgi:hypothetical protein